MFLALPVELRLRIAEYALEQPPASGIPQIGSSPQQDDLPYRPSKNLALLLVCRQFELDFTPLAYNKTRFVLWTENDVAHMRNLPPRKLRNIRKLGFEPGAVRCTEWTRTGSSRSFLCNLEQLRLDELVFLYCHTRTHMYDVRSLALFLCRLRHVRSIKFVQSGGNKATSKRWYRSLIGAVMKEDHYQRYDAPGAPNVDVTWWEWHFNTQQNTFTFQAQEPRPVLPEEDYMLLMKPKVDTLMAEAEKDMGL